MAIMGWLLTMFDSTAICVVVAKRCMEIVNTIFGVGKVARYLIAAVRKHRRKKMKPMKLRRNAMFPFGVYQDAANAKEREWRWWNG